MSYQVNYQKLFNPIISLMFFFLTLNGSVNQSLLLAQTESSNPLETNIADPLIPKFDRDRPLTPLEKLKVRKVTDRLDKQAIGLIDAGNEEKAFQLWYRQLRLKRALGRLEEVVALGRVGEVAWNQNRQQDLNIITQRLENIKQEASEQKLLKSSLLNALGKANRQVRNLETAIDLYRQILTNLRQQKNRDPLRERDNLEILGQLNLDRFDYTAAAKIYEELFKISRSQVSSDREYNYLLQLAEIYDRQSQPTNAVIIKQKLAKIYQNNRQIQELASLKIAIAEDYQSLDRSEQASQNFREAFNLAWSSQQYSIASDALEKLGNLYLQDDRFNYALEIYQQLVKVQQQSYDYYGLMNTYDRIGKIYLKQNKYSDAVLKFEQGLEIAKTLNYREDYFNKQIAAAKQRLI